MSENRLRLSMSGSQTARGASNLAALAPGSLFALGAHQRADLDGHQFLVTRVVHRTTGTGEGTARYANTFECIPVEHEYRPAHVTPRPRVFGAQTATVVGPAGEEIHTDPHGRIKVQFHWDRLQAADDTASCWTRVVQPWAGANWGGMVVPRIGMEVVVDFLDGNPDRPLVVGCVYNAANPPPYTLPDDKTKSTFKSNSSPGGDGFNEVRLEDAAGSEEIYVRAQKDYNEVVQNNHDTKVHNCQTNTVDADQTQTIGGNQTEKVVGDQDMTVDGNRTVTVQGSQSVAITGNKGNAGVDGSKLKITGDYKVDVSSTIEIQAPTHILLTCGGSTLKMTPSTITLIAGGGASFTVDADLMSVSNGASQMLISGGITATASGGGTLDLTGNALLSSSNGASKVTLDGDALMEGTAKSTVKAPLAALEGSGAGVKVDAAVNIKGTNVSIDGGPAVNVTGGTVKLN